VSKEVKTHQKKAEHFAFLTIVVAKKVKNKCESPKEG